METNFRLRPLRDDDELVPLDGGTPTAGPARPGGLQQSSGRDGGQDGGQRSDGTAVSGPQIPSVRLRPLRDDDELVSLGDEPPPRRTAANGDPLPTGPKPAERGLAPDLARGVAQGALQTTASAAEAFAGPLDRQQRRIATVQARLAEAPNLSDEEFANLQRDIAGDAALPTSRRAQLNNIAARLRRSDLDQVPDVAATLEGNLARRSEEALSGAAEAVAPSQAREGSLALDVARGVGSTAPFVAARAATGPLGLLTFSAATGQGEALERAAANGASDAEAAQAQLLGTVPGLTDAAPIENLFRAAPIAPGLKGALAGVARAAAQQGVIEGTQESVQTFLQNSIERLTSDEGQQLLEAVPENARTGALVGILFGTAGGSAQAAGRNLRPSETADDGARRATEETLDAATSEAQELPQQGQSVTFRRFDGSEGRGRVLRQNSDGIGVVVEPTDQPGAQEFVGRRLILDSEGGGARASTADNPPAPDEAPVPQAPPAAAPAPPPQAAPEVETPPTVTPEDEASPIPTDLIAEGRQIIAEGVSGGPRPGDTAGGRDDETDDSQPIRATDRARPASSASPDGGAASGASAARPVQSDDTASRAESTPAAAPEAPAAASDGPATPDVSAQQGGAAAGAATAPEIGDEVTATLRDGTEVQGRVAETFQEPRGSGRTAPAVAIETGRGTVNAALDRDQVRAVPRATQQPRSTDPEPSPPAQPAAEPEDVSPAPAARSARAGRSRGGRPRSQQTSRSPVSAVRALINAGGVRDDQNEIRRGLGISARARPGLINNRSGVDLDEAALFLEERGFFPTQDRSEVTQNDVLDLIDQDVNRGRPRFTPEDQDVVDAQNTRREGEDRAILEAEASRLGISDARVQALSTDELSAAVVREREIQASDLASEARTAEDEADAITREVLNQEIFDDAAAAESTVRASRGDDFDIPFPGVRNQPDAAGTARRGSEAGPDQPRGQSASARGPAEGGRRPDAAEGAGQDLAAAEGAQEAASRTPPSRDFSRGERDAIRSEIEAAQAGFDRSEARNPFLATSDFANAFEAGRFLAGQGAARPGSLRRRRGGTLEIDGRRLRVDGNDVRDAGGGPDSSQPTARATSQPNAQGGQDRQGGRSTADNLTAEERQRLDTLAQKTSTTAAEENTLRVLRDRARVPSGRFQPGNGVRVKVRNANRGRDQVNRGFQIASVDPESREAVVRQVADTGLTVSGGNADVVADQRVNIGDLVRDRQFDSPASSAAASAPEGATGGAQNAPFSAPEATTDPLTVEAGAASAPFVANGSRMAKPGVYYRQSPDFEGQRTAMAERLQKIATDVFGPNLNVAVLDDIHGDVGHGLSPMLGVYTDVRMPGGAMENFAAVSLGAENGEFQLNHEGIHHLRRMGALDGRRWEVLEARAAEWRRRFDIDRRYPGLSEGMKTEEAIADAFAAFATGDVSVAPLDTRPVFSRMRRFFERFRSLLQGRGFRSFDDIFQEIQRGDLARDPDADRLGAMPRFSVAPRRAPSTTAEKAINKAVQADDARGIVSRLRDSLADRARRTREEFVWAVADEFAPLKGLEQQVRGVERDRDAMAWTAARLSRHSSGQIEAFLRHGAPAWDADEQIATFKEGSKGFFEILRPIYEDGTFRLFEGYAYARRVRSQGLIESGKEKNLSQSEVDALLELANQNPQFEQIFDEIQAYKTSVLDFAEQLGLVGADQRAVWEQADHVPFFRVAEDAGATAGPGQRRGLSGQDAQIRRLTGGEDRFLVIDQASGTVTGRFADLAEANREARRLGGEHTVERGGQAIPGVVENLVRNMAHLIDASMKNNAANEAVALALEAGIATRESSRLKPETGPGSQFERTLREAGVDTSLFQEQALRAKLTELGVEVPKDASLRRIKELAAQNDLDPDQFPTKAMETIFAVAPPKGLGEDTLAVKVGGETQFFRIDDRLVFKAIEGTQRTGMMLQNSPFVQPFSLARRFFTRMITLSPEFGARNFLRDSVSSWVQTPERDRNIAKDIMKAGAEAARLIKDGTDDRMKTIQAAGADTGFFQNAPEDVVKQLRRLERERKIGIVDFVNPKTAFDLLDRLGRGLEQANRVTIFDQVLEQTGSRRAAAFEAVDIMDFQLRGGSPAIQVLTQVVPFLNARIQGLYRLGRAGFGNDEKARRSFLAKGGILAAAATALAVWNATDDDDENGYNALPEWLKDTYYVIPIGRALPEDVRSDVDLPQFLTIPKPFEVGAIFSTLPERMVQALAGNDGARESSDAAWRAVRDTFAFDPFSNPLVNVPLEQALNRNRFQDRPIVPRREQGLEPEVQFDPRFTSPVMRRIGEETGLSPRRLESVFDGFFGTIGAYGLGVADSAYRVATQAPAQPAGRLDEMLFLRSFTAQEPLRSTKWAGQFWDLKVEADGIHRTINLARKRGQRAIAEEKLRENQGLLRVREQLDSIAEQLSNLRRREQRIFADPQMSPERKRELLDEIQQRENRLVGRVGPLEEFARR